MNTQIKRFLTSVIVGLIASNSFAFTSVENIQYTARAQTSGTGKVDISNIIIKNTNDTPAGAQEIRWPNVTEAMISANKWILADQMVEIETTLTTLSGGVQLITDNRDASASPRFQDPTPATAENPLLANNPDSNPAGLVLDVAGSNYYTLPVAWTIKDSTKEVSGILASDSRRGLQPSDPESGPASGSNYRFQWLYMVDKQTPIINWNGSTLLGDTVNGIKDGDAYGAGANYQRIVDYRGRHVGQGETEFVGGPGKKKSYVYFQANFETALFGTPDAPISYKTNKLTFEAFTE